MPTIIGNEQRERQPPETVAISVCVVFIISNFQAWLPALAGVLACARAANALSLVSSHT